MSHCPRHPWGHLDIYLYAQILQQMKTVGSVQEHAGKTQQQQQTTKPGEKGASFC